MWKLKIISVSKVDSSGNAEVVYEVYIDDEIAYPQMSDSGAPNLLMQKIQDRVAALKAAAAALSAIQVGTEVEI